MRSCSKQHVLVLLTFLLTAAASGDDFCLPRLAFPSLSLGGEGLPLDDPNSDFLEATDSELVCSLQSCRHLSSGSADCGPATPSSSMHAGSCPALMVTLAGMQRYACIELNTPLRC
jgi:hypothetical protein